MPVAPELSAYEKNRIKKLNPHLAVEWDNIERKWIILFNDHINHPHVIMYATHQEMQDSRTLRQMQKNLYYSQQSYLRMARKMLQRASASHEHTRAHDSDETRQMIKEIDPVLRSLKDAGRSSHGKSKFKFQGFGEGK